MGYNSSDKKELSETIVVIGAGITGLASAWRLSAKGFKVIVLERQNFPGGLATSIIDNGFKMDIGPHFLTLPKISPITNDVKKLIGVKNLIKIKKIHESYRVYFRGELLKKYPTLYDIIFKSGVSTFIHSIWDYFIVKITPQQLKNHNSSIENYLISTYGKFLYNYWFKPYIVQNEGIGDPQQPKELIEKMFPPPTFKKILNYILKNSSRTSPTKKQVEIEPSSEYFDCYFRDGMGSIIENMLKGIKNNGGEILLGVDIQTIIHDDKTKKIHFFKDGKGHEIESKIIIYSVPPSIILKWFDDIPENINTKNQKYEAFHSIIAFLMIDAPKVFDGWLIQVYDTDLIFFRITQQNFLSDNVSPPEKSLLCVEVKCTENDYIWTIDESEIFSRIKSDLEKTKILTNKKIFNYKIIKLNNIYPIAQQTVNLNNSKIIKFINSFKNEYAVTTSTIDSGRLVSGTKEESDANNIPRLGGLYLALYNSKILTSEILEDNKSRLIGG